MSKSFTSVNANALNLMMDDNHINTNDDAFGLYNENITGPILPAQMFYGTNADDDDDDNDADDSQNKLTDDDDDDDDEPVMEKNTNFTEDELNDLFPMAGESQPETVLRHIPAKYRKSSLPAEVLNRPLETVEVKDNYVANRSWLTERVDREAAKEQGVAWKDGPWSLEEEELLRTNIDNYCERNSIVDPTLMIYSEIKDLRRSFYREINKGLNRTLFAIYRKIRRIYDTRNYAGKYNKEEEDRLMELHEELGSNWTDIGQAMGRSAASVKDKIRLLKNKKNTGHWSDDELKLLSETVHTLTKTKVGESVTTGINWKLVAEKLGTRNEKQCFGKWLNFLNWKEAGGKKWIKTDEIELISRVAYACVTCENDLDWAKLSNGWESVRSPQWLRMKWWKLKKEVPNYKTCSFLEILTHLQGPYVDAILEQCKKKTKKKKKSKVKAEHVDNEGTTQPDQPEAVTSITLTIHNTETVPTQIYTFPTNMTYEPLRVGLVLTPSISTNQNSSFTLSTNQHELNQSASNQNVPSFESLINAAQSIVTTTTNQLPGYVLPVHLRTSNHLNNTPSIAPNIRLVNSSNQQDIPSFASSLQLANNPNPKLALEPPRTLNQQDIPSFTPSLQLASNSNPKLALEPPRTLNQQDVPSFTPSLQLASNSNPKLALEPPRTLNQQDVPYFASNLQSANSSNKKLTLEPSRTLKQQEISSFSSNLQSSNKTSQKLTLDSSKTINQAMILPKIESTFRTNRNKHPSVFTNTNARPVTTNNQKVSPQNGSNLNIKDITTSNAGLILQTPPTVKMEIPNLQDSVLNDNETLTLNGTLVVDQNSDLNLNQNENSSMGINLDNVANSGSDGTINIQVLDASINYAISRT
uniref:Cyclin-D-binding Myb-like transcription factor 1 n=2 Tax=Clytia hemisphaerica TaxID=252671 RepID=A0A7M5WYU1_9CNID